MYPQPPADPFSKTNVLGYIWGALLCPTLYACADRQVTAACVFGCLLFGTMGMWAMSLRRKANDI